MKKKKEKEREREREMKRLIAIKECNMSQMFNF